MTAISDVVIPLRSRRHERGQFLQKLQHAFPAVSLLLVGVQGIMEHERGFALALAVAEIAVSVLLFRALAKSFAALRRTGGPEHGAHVEHAHGVDWVDILVAGVLVVEALEHWHSHHHLPRPTVLLAAVMLALGLFHGRIAALTARRRALRIDTNGIQVSKRFFRQLSASWADIERIEVGEGSASIVTRKGRMQRIDLADLRNGAEVRQALFAAQERARDASLHLELGHVPDEIQDHATK